MSTSWLSAQLMNTDAVIDGGDPILSVASAGRTERVYCPNSDEYRVTADVVKKAKDLGATIIAYSSTWCEATYEAKRYAKSLNVSVMPFNAFFAYLRSRGVEFRP
jgi:hypothetical protein